MRRMRWVTYLWPGLPQLGVNGSWSGLAVAVSAAALFNLALLGSFGWSELIDSEVLKALWVALGVVWVASAVFSALVERRQSMEIRADAADGNFVAAQDHYLKGNWVQAERELARLLKKNARDLDARLMLATLLRRTGRHDEAKEQLDSLTRIEGAGKWGLEIRRERELLAQRDPAAGSEVEEMGRPGPIESPTAAMHAA